MNILLKQTTTEQLREFRTFRFIWRWSLEQLGRSSPRALTLSRYRAAANAALEARCESSIVN